MFSLEGHMASVQRCMFFNHDNKLLVTSSLDGTLKVWSEVFFSVMVSVTVEVDSGVQLLIE